MKAVMLITLLFSLSGYSAELIRIGMPMENSKLRQSYQAKLEQVYHALGYRTEFIALPSARRLKLLSDSFIDGDLIRSCHFAASENVLVVPVPIDELQLKAFSLNESSLSNWQQNKQLVVSHIRGFKIAEQVPLAGKRVLVDTDEQAFGLMLKGRVDIILKDGFTAEQFMQENADHSKLVVQNVKAFTVCHVIHAKHSKLLPLLSKLLK